MVRIESNIPKYLKIIRNQKTRDFPLASKRAFAKMQTLLDKACSELRQTDFNFPKICVSPSKQIVLDQNKNDARKVLDYIINLFNGLPNWAHPLTQINLMPPTTAVSVVTAFLTALFNPDICSPELAGEQIAQAEERIVKFLSNLVGYDPQKAFGFFTYGGSLAIQYGILLGLEKASPGRFRHGQKEETKILCSEAAHFSIQYAAGILGLGSNSVIAVKTKEDGSMDLKDLDLKAREILQRGKKIACVVGTLGTTDNFALDDLRGIFYLRNKWQAEFSLNYPISIHADAAIGWAWSFFKNYDFSTNPLQFPLETLQALQKILTRIKHLEKADTVSLNPHKYGYVPIPASFILFKQEDDALSSLRRGIKEAPQLGKTTIGRSTGSYTIETTRSPIGVLTTLANFLFLGIEGYQAILGRVVEMGLLLRQKLKQIKGVEVFNEHGLGGGTTFCFTCPAWTLEEQNLINETIVNRLSFQSVPVNLSLTRIGGKTAIKSLIITPFLESEDIDKLVSSIRAVAVDMNLS